MLFMLSYPLLHSSSSPTRFYICVLCIGKKDLSLIAGTKANDEEIREHMKKFDTDEDGKIDFNDFCTCMLGIESTTGMFGIAAMVCIYTRTVVNL